MTEVRGFVADQTALLSLLQYLYDMGTILLSVEGMDAASPAGSAAQNPGGGET